MPKNDREYERLFEYYLDQHKEVLDTKIKEKIRESVEFLNNRSKKIKEEYEKKNANEKLHEEFEKFSPADIAKIINEAALEA
ncbi:MAG: hypothetical protein RMJ34_04070 [candidate division WOR-3 bacterium]|nr:hypothetical protein [candidate division WOR-3 bacterium]MDW8114096.1 hypothetical protein [candidate division WOR-3 bacterium]